MTVITLNNVNNLQDTTTSQSVINGNNTTIVNGLASSLAKTGDQMSGNLNMNSQRILNLPAPSTLAEPLRLQDAALLSGGGSININTYTAGTGISLAGNVITNTEPYPGLTAGTGISIVSNVISSTATLPSTGYYVNASTGSDSNNGLTSGTAFATLRHAVETASKYSWAGITNAVTINLAAGTYPGFEFVNTSGLCGDIATQTPFLFISGASPSTTIISNSSSSAANWCILGANSNIILTNVQIQTSGTAGSFGLLLEDHSQIGSTGPVTFSGGSSTATAIYAEQGSLVSMQGTVTVSGTYQYVFSAITSSIVQAMPPVVISGTVSSLAHLDSVSSLTVNSGSSITGSVSAQPIFCNGNSYVGNYTGTNGFFNISGYKNIMSGGGLLSPGATPTTFGTPVGLGSTGTLSYVTGSNARSGRVTLAPSGTSPGNTGNFSVTFGEVITKDGGGVQLAPCIIFPSGFGTASWTAGATAICTGNNGNGVLTFYWYDAGVALTAGSTYTLDYICV